MLTAGERESHLGLAWRLWTRDYRSTGPQQGFMIEEPEVSRSHDDSCQGRQALAAPFSNLLTRWGWRADKLETHLDFLRRRQQRKLDCQNSHDEQHLNHLPLIGPRSRGHQLPGADPSRRKCSVGKACLSLLFRFFYVIYRLIKRKKCS